MILAARGVSSWRLRARPGTLQAARGGLVWRLRARPNKE
jgi:hypothetical protein